MSEMETDIEADYRELLQKLRDSANLEACLPGPDCPDPIDMLTVVERTSALSGRASVLAHIAECAWCRREYHETKEALAVGAEARAAANAHIASARPDNTQQSGGSVWRRFRWQFAAGGLALAACGAIWLLAPRLTARPEAVTLTKSGETPQSAPPHDGSPALPGPPPNRSEARNNPDSPVKRVSEGYKQVDGTLQDHRRAVAASGPSRQMGGTIDHRSAAQPAVSSTRKPTRAEVALVSRARRSGHLFDVALLTAMETDAPRLMGSETNKDGYPAPANPARTLILDRSPILEFDPGIGANCIAALRDGAGKTVSVQKVDETHWKPEKPLEPGGRYTWWVQADVNGKSVLSAIAHFQIANSTQRIERNRILAAFSDDEVARAVVLYQLGFAREAEELLSGSGDEAASSLLNDLKKRAGDQP